jgi:hypothetical protein
MGKVDLLMAGGAAEVLLVSLSFPLPQPPFITICCFFVFAEMGAPIQHPDGWRLTYFV